MKDTREKEILSMEEESDIIETLRTEIEIPEGVQKKANEAFLKIQRAQEKDGFAGQNGQYGTRRVSMKSKTEPKMESEQCFSAQNGQTEKAVPSAEAGKRKVGSVSRTRVVRRYWAAALAAALLMLLGVGAAASYRQWSRSLEQGMRTDGEQLEALESESLLAVSGQSVTVNGVTVTVRECLVDNNFAWLVFQVEGYTPENGVQPAFGSTSVTALDGEDLYGDGVGGCTGSFYDGIVSDENGKAIYADGSEAQTDENGAIISSYVQEDGSLEYTMTMYSKQESMFIGREIHVELNNLGYWYTEGTEEVVIEVEGTWSFDLTLPGSGDSRICELNAGLGESGATVIRADISPISATIYYEVNVETDNETTLTTSLYDRAPAFIGFRMKDGTDIRGLSGVGSTGYKDGDLTVCYTTTMYNRIIDVEEIESLLFVKSYPEGSDTEEIPFTDENLYIVSLE